MGETIHWTEKLIVSNILSSIILEWKTGLNSEWESKAKKIVQVTNNAGVSKTMLTFKHKHK